MRAATLPAYPRSPGLLKRYVGYQIRVERKVRETNSASCHIFDSVGIGRLWCGAFGYSGCSYPNSTHADLVPIDPNAHSCHHPGDE
jgi:hypothetical protein